MKQNWEPRSEFFRNLIAEGLNQGRVEGLNQGRVEGLNQGRAEGRVEGEAKGLAAALLTVLESRALQPDATQREQISPAVSLHGCGNGCRMH